ncbi:hypothetical protein DL95DRAFT_449142 [Leptodontidium sp. 2 PMI_412]|nr:hypothetical protein DL95DRAFT_449142 [Leptodontidium sp. 2 PMI_412]
MPSVSTETLQRLDLLAKEHRIKFAGDLPSSKWPRCHKETLRCVTELGERKFDSFATGPNVTSDEPWKAQVKFQAALLVERSRRCHQRNESSWSKNCRKRVWRSELEASREGTSAAAAALQERQRNREPCRCSRMARSQDYLEAVGLNQIFGHREDEQVRLDRAVATKLHKDIQKPDTIFGLRETRNIENLLHDTKKRELELERGEDNQDKQLHELLDPSPITQPISQKGDKLLFPFLVLEAKSGTSDSDWYSIQMQTAFPIKAFLDTQDRLRRATGRRSKWHAGPLVWFFANKGEDWRLSAAYMEQGHPRAGVTGTVDYLVVELWKGSISTRNGALQLLLLVDYIFDWARDVYRDHIIQELRILASGENDAASIVYSDTDIHSTRQLEYSGVPDSEDVENFEEYVSNQKGYIALDSAKGIVRHATFVESRYCTIFVTPDNVQTLLQSTKQTRTQQLCRYILNHMSESIMLDLPTLVAMEKQWTGNSRLSPPGYLAEMKFYSVVSCTNYLSGNWHQVRELYVVAIAEGAWATIVDASKLKKHRGKAEKPALADTATMDSMLTTLKKLQAGSLAETLLAAITRRAVKIQTIFNYESFVQTHRSARMSSTDTSASDTSSVKTNISVPALCKAVSDNGAFRDIVHYIYKFFKKGNLEPQESFMRVSKRFDQQHLLQFDVEPISTTEAPLRVSDSGCVLISSTCHSHDPDRSKSRVCIYTVEGEPTAPSREQLFQRLMDTVETRDVYHTTQDNGTSNLTNMKEIPWNLEKTYGIYSEHYGFLRFLTGIGKDIGNRSVPSMQGSPRTSAESGSYLFTRNIVPWQDPRRLGGNIEGRMFTVFKLMASEISYWKTRAESLSAEGIACCKICATSLEDDIGTCFQCFTALREFDDHSWLGNLIQGRMGFPEGNEDSDESDSDSASLLYLRTSQDQWKANLAGHPSLDEDFGDLVELFSQYMKFTEWASKQRRARWMKSSGTKRKRQNTSLDGHGRCVVIKAKKTNLPNQDNGHWAAIVNQNWNWP